MKVKKSKVKKSRKVLRKEFRKAKKVKKHDFFSRKRNPDQGLSKDIKKDTIKGLGNDISKAPEPWKIKRSREAEGSNAKTNDEKLNRKRAVQNQRTDVPGKTKVRKFSSVQDELQYEQSKEESKVKKLKKEMSRKRIDMLKADNEMEDKTIRKLEKQLKFKKRKEDSIHKSFAVDGLDYLLEVCNKNSFGKEKDFDESDSDFGEDLALIKGSKKVEVKLKKSKKSDTKKESKNDTQQVLAGNESDSEEDDDVDDDNDEIGSDDMGDMESDNISGDNDDEELESNDNEETESIAEKEDKKDELELEDEDEDEVEDGDEDEDGDVTTFEKGHSKKAGKVFEDIYGRTRDEHGNVIQTYKPPQFRKIMAAGDDQNQERLLRLRKQLKGLLNRLAESNMASISSQIEELYMSNSRNAMNETLCQLLSESLICEVLHPERLVAEHAMLIAILNGNVGSEVGAHCLQYMVTKFHKMLNEDTDVEDKKINNTLQFIIHLYSFKVFHSILLFDIISKLLKNLREKKIELLLMILRSVGFTLRKDDPVALKSLVLSVQKEANRLTSGEISSRVKFMLDIVLAIKNNNMSKIPNYDPEMIEHLKKSLKVIIRKGQYISELKISLEDLLKAEEQGRWWVVGSAWSGQAPGEHALETEKQAPLTTTFSQKLLELARKQRMNTDVRRNVFCLMMSAEDYLDAFEKLVRLGLKGTMEREIMNVLLHCALQEKNSNPYYIHLANRFCLYDRRFKIMLQCALWDKIKDIKDFAPLQVTNLAKFIGNVCLETGLSISVLKVIEFAELDKLLVRFVRQVLLSILLIPETEKAIAVFAKISQSKNLKVFREGLRLFLHHFMLRNTKQLPETDVVQLKKMVHAADKALSSTDLNLAF